MKGAQPHRIVQTVALLAMAVMELRRIADQEPSTSAQLRQIANQLEDEANDLARLSGGE
jgi:FtsZ-binding cell division protein ZapB